MYIYLHTILMSFIFLFSSLILEKPSSSSSSSWWRGKMKRKHFKHYRIPSQRTSRDTIRDLWKSWIYFCKLTLKTNMMERKNGENKGKRKRNKKWIKSKLFQLHTCEIFKISWFVFEWLPYDFKYKIELSMLHGELVVRITCNKSI